MRRLHYTDDADRNLIEIAIRIATESSSRDVAAHFAKRLHGKCRQLAPLPACNRVCFGRRLIDWNVV